MSRQAHGVAYSSRRGEQVAAAGEPVGGVVAAQAIVAVPARDPVVARAAIESVGVGLAAEAVVAVGARDAVVALVAGTDFRSNGLACCAAPSSGAS